MPIPLSIESLGDLSFISLPLTLMVPESAWYKPYTILINVDLPAPFSPMMP